MTSLYSAPDLECDLIMQGGITSGVVYPPAVLKLAPGYRFRNIGGTSAGAIAAAATAAAELGRDSGGFDRLASVPASLARDLSSLFQPRAPFNGAFKLFLAGLGQGSVLAKLPRILAALLLHFWIWIGLGLLPVAIYIWRTFGADRDALEWIAILAAALIGIVLALLFRAFRLLFVDLPRSNFGVCSGLQPEGATPVALTEWIANLLDSLANKQSGERPLTFGDLAVKGIELKMMTTNLSLRRPYSLPLHASTATADGGDHPSNPARENRYAFNETEWRGLFPAKIMDHLCSPNVSEEVSGHSGFRYLPDVDAFPVVVAVRMSLSFPILLAAIPLYRRDPLYLMDAERQELRRCVFSDGGISSNFPIQFFDAFLPSRPTFGISLDEYSPLRYQGTAPQDLVDMPANAGGGALLPIRPVDSLPGFIIGIVDSARLWQDNLQKVLPGYRERIAHIALTDFEGGLNLNMAPPVIERLGQLGDAAGNCMLHFNLDEHRWRRFLVAFVRLEESLEQMHDSYYLKGFQAFLNRYPPLAQSYRNSPAWVAAALQRLEEVMKLAGTWRDTSLRTQPGANIPKPETDLRMTPKP